MELSDYSVRTKFKAQLSTMTMARTYWYERKMYVDLWFLSFEASVHPAQCVGLYILICCLAVWVKFEKFLSWKVAFSKKPALLFMSLLVVGATSYHFISTIRALQDNGKPCPITASLLDQLKNFANYPGTVAKLYPSQAGKTLTQQKRSGEG